MSPKILVVEAHPDDAEWYCGGTLAKLAREGAEITFVICTRGEKGSYDPLTDPDELERARVREQEAARQLLGVREIVYLGVPDGELQPTLELRKRLALLYRKYQPDILLTFDPWKRDELHPDHRACGVVALDARIAAKMPLYYARAENSNAWATPELWLFNTDAPNHFVDVTDFIETRVAALKLHASQSVGDVQNIAHVLATARADGEKIGVEYAEAFHRILIEGSIARAR
ncbi:MAG: PIG-L family deacetylase [Chloroflexi bacterium]|nr:PIG-L family deacetylase [Chloroflexota bacterium]